MDIGTGGMAEGADDVPGGIEAVDDAGVGDEDGVFMDDDALGAAHAAVREISPHVDADRSLAAEIEALAERMRDGSLLASVERGSAPLR